ncbi:DUF3558 domain-containing protein [Nocardia jiangxiensis]|uniref:DUF3558 domain-containing protein n=1 Tax=Nocardia jiangxiensis TaxID=282685 RepID=UPI00146E7D74|nr:DUF3558 domain-containing protein [Nocardia jiangxiensis]
MEIIPGLIVEDEIFAAAAAALATHAPDRPPLMWEIFADATRWWLIPRLYDDSAGVPLAYKAEFILLETLDLTIKINVWFLPDLRDRESSRPHTHPWEVFEAYPVLGAYEDENWHRSASGLLMHRGSMVHRPGMVNRLFARNYHEVTFIEAPGRTVSVMICGRRVTEFGGSGGWSVAAKPPRERGGIWIWPPAVMSQFNATRLCNGNFRLECTASTHSTAEHERRQQECDEKDGHCREEHNRQGWRDPASCRSDSGRSLMLRIKTSAGACVLAVLAASVAACSAGGDSAGPSAVSSSASAPTTSIPATLTAANLQPPLQNTRYTRAGGRPKVVFDPCTWIPDDALAEIGFDPTTRERAQDLVAEYTFLSCQVETADQARTLQLDSGNITLVEDKQRYAGKTQLATVDGREAITTQKTNADECDLDMRTKAGYFEIGVIVETAGRVKGLQPCDHIVDIATTLEPYVGDN